MEAKDLIEKLEELLEKRNQQLDKEAFQSYNYGYVAGEISGIEKAIKTINENIK